jgi:hypothetical protein
MTNLLPENVDPSLRLFLKDAVFPFECYIASDFMVQDIRCAVEKYLC